MTIAIIAACVLVVLIIVFILISRDHNKWLGKQSLEGVWITEVKGATITIQFEQTQNATGNKGIYKQVTKNAEGKEIREFGHWTSDRDRLHMIILETKIKNHSRVGQDTEYTIKYISPDRIAIKGPDRDNLKYDRAPKDTEIDLTKSVNKVTTRGDSSKTKGGKGAADRLLK